MCIFEIIIKVFFIEFVIFGVINLCGKMFLLVSLRMLFGLFSISFSDSYCVLVVNIFFLEKEWFFVGVVVDVVCEVICLYVDVMDSVLEIMSKMG